MHRLIWRNVPGGGRAHPRQSAAPARPL